MSEAVFSYLVQDQATTNQNTADARLLLRPARAFQIADVPRSTGYLLIATGEWPSIRIGPSNKTIRIPVKGLQEWIERKLTEAEQARQEGA